MTSTTTTTRTTTSTVTPQGRMVTGLFNDRASAERAYESLSARGYGRDDVNLVMSEDTRKTHFGSTDGVKTELGNKAAEGAGVGGAIGGTVGAVLGGDCCCRYDHRHSGSRSRHRGAAGRGDCRRGCRRRGGRSRRRARGLGHPGRARQALRSGHQEGRHPDGRAFALG